MASTANTDMASAVSPAQIAALSVSLFAIFLFTSISIYLCGQRKGCKEATQRAIHSIAHLHQIQHHPHTRIPEDATSRHSTTNETGTNGGGGRLTRLKEVLRINAVVTAADEASSSSAEKKSAAKSPRIRATSPLQIGIHPSSSSNPYSGTEEFQAAVHNLLGYRPGELQEWYPESHDDAHEETQSEHDDDEGSFSAIGQCGSPLPAYAEVAEPRRFSWEGRESDYRPEKSGSN